MSTAEQIIAKHQFMGTYCTGCEWDLHEVPENQHENLVLAHAAHVVAALTNAGRAIVELPEVAADDITIGVVSALHDYGAIDIETSPDFVRMFESTGWYSAEAMTFLGSALIAVAAARVTEGGGQP
ncbi:hypothetical protein GS435_02730 [Rhodococcus hoagii]|nr:hypothetical protein [Prescottella equi]